ncbi:MAG: carboxypeptidase regulatory-like domain-containing protein [Myxococcales bacterium]|nr:carboxypeptidase regulatory-like domain-containing protein [Myxococcales bacterium]
MRTISRIFATSLFSMTIALGGCVASNDGGGNEVPAVDADRGGGDLDMNGSSLIGTVWVPGNAPGMVPAGHEIPVFDAVVYLSSGPALPIEEGATCRPCLGAPPNAVQTDHKGTFSIPGVMPGDYWMIIEKGDFRLEQQITVASNQVINLTAAQTTLPSVHDLHDLPRRRFARSRWRSRS